MTRLERYRQLPRERFLIDEDLQLAAERCLHLATECVIDLANHILSDRALPTPSGYADAFRVLRDAGVLEPELAGALQQWAGMRNILVHEYLGIDHSITWETIANDLDDLRRFATVVLGMLDG